MKNNSQIWVRGMIAVLNEFGYRPIVAPRWNRFDTNYSDPGRVIADLAAAYPNKFIWGSDSPFYSYAAKIDGEIVRLISTYQREVEVLKQSPPEVVNRIANINTRGFLKLQVKTHSPKREGSHLGASKIL